MSRHPAHHLLEDPYAKSTRYCRQGCAQNLRQQPRPDRATSTPQCLERFARDGGGADAARDAHVRHGTEAGRDRAWCRGQYVDALRAQFVPECLGELLHIGFGGGVMRGIRHSLESDD